MSARHLYAVHDASADWAGIIRDAGMTGWAVHSESIGADPGDHSGQDYRWLAGYGVTPLVRLNYSHHGEGSLPLPDRYDEFAARCANFVTASTGCRHWIIANETNSADERPGGIPITPRQYADCFNRCRSQIKQRGYQHSTIVAAVAPYNEQTGWCIDYWREMLGLIAMQDGADGLALHTYSRGGDPSSIYSEDKMESYPDCYSGFRAYRDFLGAVPASMRGLPSYITETNQIDPWVDANSGWVRNAYDEIDDWNKTAGNQQIYFLALYRWERHDRWTLQGKNGVIEDFRQALQLGYTIPVDPQPGPGPTPPDPQPPRPTPEPPAHEVARRDIDPQLLARGVHFEFAQVPEGTGYWRITAAEWLDEAEADAMGPDHHILGSIERDDLKVAGVQFLVSWPSGNTTIHSKAAQDMAGYNYDFPMSASLNEFSIWVNDGAPSDKASGIGMGMLGNPGIHTSTWIDWEWTIATTLEPPKPPPSGDVEAGIVTASAGLNVREGPSTEHAILGTLDFGSTVLYDSERDGWLHVVEGYVSGEYVGPETFEGVEPAAPMPVAGKLIWPVHNARITQRFGDRYEYYQEHFDALGHNGLDFGLAAGSPIYATADGIVTMAQDDKPGYGVFCRLFHPRLRLGSLYAHCQELLVAEGEHVLQGQQIATVGSSGNSSGPHLHWELCAQDAGGYINVSYGHSKGRANPEVVMWILGTPPVYQ